jgi:hypothetical protein
MKKFLILFLFIARFGAAAETDVETWLIQYYSIPTDAKILDFEWWPARYSTDKVAAGTPYRFRISWETQSSPGHYHQHSRTFDMKGGTLESGITVLQSDD